VASLWPVNDISTMLLMKRMYDNHGRGMALPEALRCAQLWLRDVSAGELAELFRGECDRADGELTMTFEQASGGWRRFVIPAPEDKPFAHPYYWGAFIYTGA
jgi:CHAT domain-containing protein